MLNLWEIHGSIEAWDIYEHRINLIKENCKRLGIEIVNTKLHDASKEIEKEEQYDRGRRGRGRLDR